MMAETIPERRLIIRSRMAEGYQLSEIGRKNLQHVLTDWLPRTLYYDLTDDTASVDVVVRNSFTGKNVFTVTFKKAGGSVIKNAEYAEERMLGKVCKAYDPKKTRYDGNTDGFDHRLVIYTPDTLNPPTGS
jgi:hypothetical protein